MELFEKHTEGYMVWCPISDCPKSDVAPTFRSEGAGPKVFSSFTFVPWHATGAHVRPTTPLAPSSREEGNLVSRFPLAKGGVGVVDSHSRPKGLPPSATHCGLQLKFQKP